MYFSTRRVLALAILCATLFLAACEEVTPTPRPTRTRPIATPVVVDTETPTETPTLTFIPTSTPTIAAQPTPRVIAPQIPKPIVNDPLLPIFGPFPPKPIPTRPANINPLTGLLADPAMLQRRPIVARIGNDKPVRDSNWQAGLSMADIVFEELIDILGTQYANTRYSAVYLSNDPPLIGPIRSERIVNFQIAPMLDAALANAGGSNGTRWLFSQSPVINLDEYFNQPAYCYIQREGKFFYMGRLYASGPRLREWMQQKKEEAPVPLYGFSFADRAPTGQPVTTVGLLKSPWPATEAVQWKYDAPSGTYLRFTAGTAQTDVSFPVTAKWGNGATCVTAGAEKRAPVTAANVVVLYAKHAKTDIIEDS
ncbi:MAG: DUF3048 domain-containing protein, partial [Chloroflexota bacterium]|nr:DUF3048 domain-containing protein [Chloroflexota bacterium]